uniref:Cas12f1-like TNB domain-containing protein n=1 Tax=Globisporangium ultimum (strain ATCC 200006 / CBS 805.95 / DAOM BR144) TaxID=431595 RepID=K3W9P9_GLOUD
MKNCVKELHYQTSAYLTKYYDMILLPIFQMKDMSHCSRLHFKLGSNDVFRCPHCEYTAGRDVNAAFNILRFVCGGSLAISKVYC